MRIAVSGAHHVGKSTLVNALSFALADCRVVDEPYHLLEEEGHEFSDPPSLEDFERQLERSIAQLNGSGADVLFDRCPIDLLAYASVHEDGDGLDLGEWLSRAMDALRSLDLIVFVPIEVPDRVIVPASADRVWRARVDAALRELLIDERAGGETAVIEVGGTVPERTRAVLAHVRAGDARNT